MFIDTHTHLFLPEFNNDRDEAIQRAIDNNVRKMILPNVDSSTLPAVIALADKYPGVCYPLIGLHPTSVKKGYDSELEFVEQQIKNRKYYGIGETGIDLYWDKTYLEQQKEAFRFQIELSLEYDLPVIIHARDSFDEIFKVLREFEENIKGIFHSFTGTIEQAREAINKGLKIGVGGIATFKNAGVDKVVKQIDLKDIVLETDSPYLAPVPKRGKRNESAYLPYIAKRLAEIYQTDIKKVEDITTKNALELFKLDENER